MSKISFCFLLVSDHLDAVIGKGPEDVMEVPYNLAARSYTSFPWSTVSPTVGLGRGGRSPWVMS